MPRMMNAYITKEWAVPGIAPLEQLLLAEDLDHLALGGGAEAPGDALDAVRSGLAAADRTPEEPHPLPRERQRHRVHQQTDNQHQRSR